MNNLHVGFVVNIFNSLNFDIFIEDLPPPQGEMFNEFTYVDEHDPTIKRGKTHRCRLAGILRRKHPVPYEDYITSVRFINMLIYKLNGWVLVKIKGRDKFRRLLVELFDIITGESINDMLKTNKVVYINYVV